MRAIIRTFLVLSLTLVFGASISHAQGMGVRIEADIPFDFSIGDKSFSAGKYDLAVFRINGTVHSVQLRDDSGKLLLTTTAIQNGSTMRKSDMLFATVDAQHYLDKIRTPDCGFVFSKVAADKRVAKAKRESVPASGATPN